MSTSTTQREAVRITIDDKSLEVEKGSMLLAAARQAGIQIPTLCSHCDLKPKGLCRMCVVEIEGQTETVSSCNFEVVEPIRVRTRSTRILQERRRALNRFFADHYGWPRRGYRYCQQCERDGSCELMALAAEYGADPGPDAPPMPEKIVVGLGEVLDHEAGKCISCERCARACDELQGIRAISMTDATEDDSRRLPKMDDKACVNCGQCAAHCPTAALRPRDNTRAIRELLDDPSRHVVVQVAPAPRVAIGERFKQEPGTPLTWQLATALRSAGFKAVFDTCFSADLTIIEEGTELLSRLFENSNQHGEAAPLPMLTSCCPGWVRYLEQNHPQYIAHLSTCKSPQQMMGALVKTFYAQSKGIDPANIVSVSLMPCVAKKFESRRPEMRSRGVAHVDFALSTRECAVLLQNAEIDPTGAAKGGFDDVFAGPSGSGVIFGHSGGVMEAALRTVLELTTGQPSESLLGGESFREVPGFEGCRIAEVQLPDRMASVPELLQGRFSDFDWLRGATLKVGVVHGLGAIGRVMAAWEAGKSPFADCHFIEFMACQAGCISGGGQPVPVDEQIRSARAAGLRSEDLQYGQAGLPRKSHENPAVLRVYGEWLKEGPGLGLAHDLLHTKYQPTRAAGYSG